MGFPNTTHHLDRWLTAVAETRHAVVAREEILEAGFTKKQIQRRLEGHRLFARFPGVYAIGRPDLTRHGHWLAGVLYAGEGAVLATWSAAALHALRRSSGPRPHVAVPRDFGPRTQAGLAVRRCPTLRDNEVTEVDGIPVTTIARTLLDIAAVSRRDDVLRKMLIEAENVRVFDLAQFDELLGRRKGNRGVARLRRALEEHRDVDVNSDLEVDFLLLCERFELPPPDVNCLIEGYLVDFAWQAQRVLVEIDTPKFHGTDTAFESNRERDTELHACGYRVLRFTRRRIVREPAVVARTIRRVLALSGPQAPR